MNTTLHQTFSYTAYNRKPAPQAAVTNRIQAFFNLLFGLFAPADDLSALRYMGAKYNDAID
jgi:hypothetical protein